MIQARDPQVLMRIGMLSVIRDLQEWVGDHGGEFIPVKLIQTHLLQALVAAGGSEDPDPHPDQMMDPPPYLQPEPQPDPQPEHGDGQG